jgi:hypothetical protein
LTAFIGGITQIFPTEGCRYAVGYGAELAHALGRLGLMGLLRRVATNRAGLRTSSATFIWVVAGTPPGNYTFEARLGANTLTSVLHVFPTP